MQNEYNSTLHYLVYKNHYRALEKILQMFKHSEDL